MALIDTYQWKSNLTINLTYNLLFKPHRVIFLNHKFLSRFWNLFMFTLTYLCPHKLVVEYKAAAQKHMAATHTSDSLDNDGPVIVTNFFNFIRNKKLSYELIFWKF